MNSIGDELLLENSHSGNLLIRKEVAGKATGN